MGPGNSFSLSPSWYCSIQKNQKQDPRMAEVAPPIGATPPTPWAPGLTLQKFAKFATADPGKAGLLMKVLPHPQVQMPLGAWLNFEKIREKCKELGFENFGPYGGK